MNDEAQLVLRDKESNVNVFFKFTAREMPFKIFAVGKKRGKRRDREIMLYKGRKRWILFFFFLKRATPSLS